MWKKNPKALFDNTEKLPHEKYISDSLKSFNLILYCNTYML